MLNRRRYAVRSAIKAWGLGALPVLVAWLPSSSLQGGDAPSFGTNALAGVGQFEIHPAFTLELVASEPLIQDPVDLQFDEHGTAYVMEMGGYPFASDDPNDYPGKIVMIEDTNHDGVYDRRTVFADKFQYANSILPYRGGILVASPPDILFLKDTDGDHRADVRDVLVTGFSVGNAQHNVNGLIQGLDNWIYAGNGGNSGVLSWTGRSDEKFPVRGRDIRFDFARQLVDFVGPTTTGFSVAIDDWGHIFTTHNLKHINHLVVPIHDVERNPYLAPRGNPDISDHKTGGLDRGYPIGKQESRLNHPEQSGYFSCSCGITFYGGGAFPEEFNGSIFVADAVLNIVHRDRPYPDGPSFLAARGREKIEFLATADRHSRPVNLRVGPDGALYVVDMYRAVIEHPEWIPDELEKDMDLRAGADQGRIYRIAPRNGLPRVTPRFDRKDLDSVVHSLEHRNRWWRDTAQRLLVWWDDPACVAGTRALFATTSLPQARVHILWTLRGLSPQPDAAPGLGALTGDLLVRAFHDPHPGVRENALIIAKVGLASAPQRIAAVVELARDPDARVRMQTALTLGEVRAANLEIKKAIREALLEIARQDVQYDWTRFAILTCLGDEALPVFTGFLREQTSVGQTDSDRDRGRDAFIHEIAELIGAQRDPGRIAEALENLIPALGDSLLFAVIDGLNAGLAKEGQLDLPAPIQDRVNRAAQLLQKSASTPLISALWTLQRHLRLDLKSDRGKLLAEARDAVLDPKRSPPDRLAWLRLLEFSEFSFRKATLWQLLGFQVAPELQSAALRQLTDQHDPAVASALIDRWPKLGRACRSQASDFLIYRSANHNLLLTALEEGRVPMGQLNLDLERRRRLLWSEDPAIRQRAEALFSDAGVVTRAEVQSQLKPALQLQGDPEKGHLHYQNVCAQCHRMGSEGNAVGPDLTEISRKGAETLLSDVFDPNAAVNTEVLGLHHRRCRRRRLYRHRHRRD